MAPVAELETRSAALQAWQAVLRPARVLFGFGRLAELGPVTAGLGGRRALLVTDTGVRAAGHVAAAFESLRQASVEVAVFDQVAENPTTEHVEAAAAAGRQHQVDCLIGLGGGSAMDTAKGANFLLTNGGRIEDYWGWNRARLPMLPSVGVPTTTGTGSEAQSYALIAQAESHRKMACGDEKARFSAVILDPLLARTAPLRVTAVAAYDAISHAVESLVSRTASPLSRLFSREAWRLLERSYERALEGSVEEAVWSDLSLGAYLAGAAIEASMLGAAHACANPLTARFGVAHGAAVGLLLPAVVRVNAATAAAHYAELSGVDPVAAGESLALRLELLRAVGGLPQRLGEVGVDDAAVPALAADALEQWTLGHNPRTLGEAELVALYRSVL